MREHIEIEALFPERVISERRVTLEAFWHGEDIGRPVIAAVPWNKTTCPDSGVDAIIDSTIDAFQVLARVPVDVIPKFGLGGGTVALASAFGGEVTVESNGKSWIKPVIHKTADAYQLTTPKPTDGIIGTWIEYYQAFSRSVTGHIPIGMPDMQGPLQTAAMLWGVERIIYEMYDNPDAVHRTLDVVTEYIISVSEYLRENFTDTHVESYPPAYLPQSHGQGLTEDFVQLLSPELYERFGLPYVNQIARRFDGIWLHCCASCTQHWPAFQQIHNLRGLDTMYPFTKPEAVVEAFPNIVHSIGLDYAESQRNFQNGRRDGWLEFLLRRIPRDVRWVFVTGCDDEDTVPRQLELIHAAWA